MHAIERENRALLLHRLDQLLDDLLGPIEHPPGVLQLRCDLQLDYE